MAKEVPCPLDEALTEHFLEASSNKPRITNVAHSPKVTDADGRVPYAEKFISLLHEWTALIEKLINSCPKETTFIPLNFVIFDGRTFTSDPQIQPSIQRMREQGHGKIIDQIIEIEKQILQIRQSWSNMLLSDHRQMNPEKQSSN